MSTKRPNVLALEDSVEKNSGEAGLAAARGAQCRLCKVTREDEQTVRVDLCTIHAGGDGQ